MRIVTLDASARENILSSLLKRDPNNYESYTAAAQIGRASWRERVSNLV